MNAILQCLLLIIGSYLLGSLSSAILVTRVWTGKDIRTLGNRNAGAANVARSVGLLPAALVTVVDFSKGAIPVFIARYLNLADLCAITGASAAVIGHSYPIYFRFRGGKGLAASLGALLALTPVETLLVLPVLGLVYLVLTGSAVTGALVALVLLIGLNFWRGYSLVVVLSPLVFLIVMALCTLPQAIQDWRRGEDKGQVIVSWLHQKEREKRNGGVAIVTDSVSSLPADIYVRERIRVVPMALVLPDGAYQDGIDIDPRTFYRRLREDQVHPKTSAPSPGEFAEVFDELSERYDTVVVLTPPKELTQTWNSAKLAGEQVAGRLTIQVIDSRTAGPAQGFLAVAAARALAEGADREAIVQSIQQAQRRVGLIGVLDTLKYLVAGGRVPAASRWIQSALQVYPLVYLVKGQVRLMGMARTKSKAVERMVRWVLSRLSGKRVSLAVFHTDALAEAVSLSDRLTAELNPEESFITEMTPVVGAHAGPGLVGVAWWEDPLKPPKD
jgi:acyl-phosphate glycerol 3-phosphate acyltransferase